jgi:hypothetical protein
VLRNFYTAARSACGALYPAHPASDTCVDLRIGSDRTADLKWLNRHSEHQVEQQAAPPPSAPLSAQSPSNQLGTASDTAARENMGDAMAAPRCCNARRKHSSNPLMR